MIDVAVSPAAWSAAAAIFSALTAFFAFRQQRRAALLQYSPNLMLEGFEAVGGEGVWRLNVAQVRNLGPGPAERVTFIFDAHTKGAKESVGGAEQTQLRGPNEVKPVNGFAVIPAPTLKGRFAFRRVVMTVLCWDVVGQRHSFAHELLVLPQVAAPAPGIPLNVLLGSRRRSRAPVWLLKLRRSLRIGG